MTMSAFLYSLLCTAGDSASVCKRAPTVCNLFANISEISCASIQVFDVTPCEAISTILLEVRIEYSSQNIYSTAAIPAITANMTILVLELCSLPSIEGIFTHPKPTGDT
jgi:hypothetical protein